MSIKSTTEIYVQINGQRQGPYLISQIRYMWDHGSITANALYWHQDLPEWKPIAELFESTAERSKKRVRYNEEKDTFSGSLTDVMKLGVKAVQKAGFKIDQANEELGILTFQTGTNLSSWQGGLCSLSFEETKSGNYRVKATGKNAGPIGLDIFNSALKQAEHVIDLMADLAD